MPFCPKCRVEFQDWVKLCSDCGIPLVDELIQSEVTGPDSTVNSSDDRLVILVTAPNEPVAMFWSGILENEGIRCMVKAVNDLKAAMYLPSISSRYQINVLAFQAEKAKDILTPFLSDAEGSDTN